MNDDDPKIPKWLIVALFLMALVVACCGESKAEEQEYRAAPVVKFAKESVMVQIGWQRYPKKDDVLVLYCIDNGSPTYSCVVYVKVPEGAGVVLVEGVTPSGGSF